MGWDAILNPFEYLTIPFGDWVQATLDYFVAAFRSYLISFQKPIQVLLISFERGLRSLHPLIAIAAAFFLCWQGAGVRIAALVAAALTGLGLIGAWHAAMTTFSIVLSALCLCTVIGLPLGILAAKSDRLERVLRPLLDFMQTTPSFVYLVPVVMMICRGLDDRIGQAP